MPPSTRPSLPSLLAMLVASCGGTPPPADPPPQDAHDSAGSDSAGATSSDPRALAPTATFAQLLDAARGLDDRRDQGSDAGCLLRASDGYRLEADLAVAARPLAEAPEDLDDRLAADGGAVNVLSRWGAYGSGDAARPTLVAVTTTLPPRREPAVVWAVGDAGIFVRSSTGASPAPAVPLDAAVAALGDLEAIGALFVTAESGTPLRVLAEVLGRVPEALSGRVALAVTLAEGTRLPAPPAAQAATDDAFCPDGLPPLAEDAPEGVIRPHELVASLGPLRQGAAICVGATQGPGAAGGRVVLAFRIGPDGLVSESCVVEDETGDPALRHCLARAARTVGFPVPRPAGYLDAQLPMALSPLESQRQRALCR